MAVTFRPNAIVSSDGTIIALVHIESIGQINKGTEDAVIDKLKNDITFTVTTVSGKNHTISIERLIKAYKKECSFDDDMHNVYLSVLDRWIHLLGL
jgi:ribosomal protein S1